MKILSFPQNIDVAFLTIHGTFGEDGQIQQILEDRGVPYTGDGVNESRTAFDKIESKKKFEAAGVTTPRWQIIDSNERPTLPLPFVVKAPRQGSTVGIYIIKSADQLENGLAEARKFDRRLLVEEFVPGRELTVGILGDQALPIIEIIPKSGFYDFTNKYPFLNPQAGGGAEHVCPAKIEETLIAPNSGPGVARVSLDRSVRLFASGCAPAAKRGTDGFGSKHYSGNDGGESVTGSGRRCGHQLRGSVSADYRIVARARGSGK